MHCNQGMLGPCRTSEFTEGCDLLEEPPAFILQMKPLMGIAPRGRGYIIAIPVSVRGIWPAVIGELYGKS